MVIAHTRCLVGSNSEGPLLSWVVIVGLMGSGTKIDKKLKNFQRPVSKMPAQAFEIYVVFFIFPSPVTKKLPVEAISHWGGLGKS